MLVDRKYNMFARLNQQKKRGCPLASLRKYPSIQAQTKRYRDAGWNRYAPAADSSERKSIVNNETIAVATVSK